MLVLNNISIFQIKQR